MAEPDVVLRRRDPAVARRRRLNADECEKCGGDSRVIRVRRPRGKIVRRRQCLDCRHRWNTSEFLE